MKWGEKRHDHRLHFSGQLSWALHCLNCCPLWKFPAETQNTAIILFINKLEHTQGRKVTLNMRISFSFLFPGKRGAPTDTRTLRNTGNWGRAKGGGEHGGEIIIIIIINNNNKITSPGEREPWEDLRPKEKL